MNNTKEIKTGRRKTSVAQARLAKGTGVITVNAKALADYFKGHEKYQATVKARSVAEISEELKKTVKKAGFLTRDPRMVERKKPGQPGARKRFQFSKR